MVSRNLVILYETGIWQSFTTRIANGSWYCNDDVKIGIRARVTAIESNKKSDRRYASRFLCSWFNDWPARRVLITSDRDYLFIAMVNNSFWVSCFRYIETWLINDRKHRQRKRPVDFPTNSCRDQCTITIPAKMYILTISKRITDFDRKMLNHYFSLYLYLRLC